MRQFVAAVFLVLVAGVRASGDGCHFGKRGHAEIARIPAQRAFIAFRDGTETLIIESGVSSESPELGWVIPLPSVPAEIDRADRGALKTLSLCLGPDLVHDPPAIFWLSSLMLFILLLWAIPFLHGKRPSLLTMLLFLFCFVMVAGMLLPALGRARGAARQVRVGVTVHRRAEVGSYNVAVLTAQSAQDLDAWLRENGFASLPDDARAIVADYVEKKWCFSVAQLIRREGGTSIPAAPHRARPVRTVFRDFRGRRQGGPVRPAGDRIRRRLSPPGVRRRRRRRCGRDQAPVSK